MYRMSAAKALLGVLLVCSGTTEGQQPEQKMRQVITDQKTDTVRPLIDSIGLAKILNNDNVRVIDVGPERTLYDQGHIPGALFVHWIRDITDQQKLERYNLIQAQTMQDLLRRLGIKKEHHIVLYDNLSSRLATRMYWSLKVYGHRRVSILDGGRQAWKQGNMEFTKIRPEIKPSHYQVPDADKRLSADMTYIREHLNDKQVMLIDGRPPKQYTGEEPGKVYHTGTAHKNRGHIPGAVHIFWKDNFHPDGTFKSAKELEALYANSGLPKNSQKTTVTYCNEGLHAAPAWFVLRELLGHQDVRVYDDSMSEWANTDQPIEMGKEKSNPAKSQP